MLRMKFVSMMFSLNLLFCYVFALKKGFIGIENLFKNRNKNQKNKLMMGKTKLLKTKEERYDYYEDWCSGEVPWEFESTVHTVIVPTKTKIIYEDDDELDFKQPMCVSSGVVKVLYNDIVNKDTILTQIENINLSDYILKNYFVDLFTFSLIGIIGYSYKLSIKNEMNFIEKQNLNFSKKITLTEIKGYLIMQKIIKTIMFVILIVLTKNIKSVE
jgi:hypothetical protein